MENENYEKARQICEAIVKHDYGGRLSDFEREFGSYQKAHEQIFFWLEDGNGDGEDVETCRLMYEL